MVDKYKITPIEGAPIRADERLFDFNQNYITLDSSSSGTVPTPIAIKDFCSVKAGDRVSPLHPTFENIVNGVRADQTVDVAKQMIEKDRNKLIETAYKVQITSTKVDLGTGAEVVKFKDEAGKEWALKSSPDSKFTVHTLSLAISGLLSKSDVHQKTKVPLEFLVSPRAEDLMKKNGAQLKEGSLFVTHKGELKERIKFDDFDATSGASPNEKVIIAAVGDDDRPFIKIVMIEQSGESEVYYYNLKTHNLTQNYKEVFVECPSL